MIFYEELLDLSLEFYLRCLIPVRSLGGDILRWSFSGYTSYKPSMKKYLTFQDVNT